jgi:hypothetical protein
MGLREFFLFEGFLPYREAIDAVHQAKGLLLLVPHGCGFESCVPSKLYSYLFATAPILLLGPEGDAARIIRETGRGIVLMSNDKVEVAEQLAEFVKKIRGRNLDVPAQHARVDEYTMERIASKMEGVLLSS